MMIMSSKITPGLLALTVTDSERPVETLSQIDPPVVSERLNRLAGLPVERPQVDCDSVKKTRSL